MFMIYNKFFRQGGMLFKEELSHYNGQSEDFELTDGKEHFLIEELEVFKINYFWRFIIIIINFWN